MPEQPDDDRRTFLRIAVIGGIGILTAGAGAASVFLPPKTGQSAGGGPQPLIPMARLAALLKEEVLSLEISLSVRDGWRLRTKRQRVYLQRVADTDDAAAFKALSPVCSHAGCTIEYHEKEKQFHCPCHGAKFKQDGSLEKGPAPRDMDPLEVTVADHDGASWLFVNWQEFVMGTEQRTPRGNA
ncbi:MAG: Cytochrome b6-f complex iron-sulfur subunit [Planctomycetes bacterium]|nr:Cytochrome b6-f complex iron-sulfur subunit [Planctomycetota bacterium]